MSKDCIVLKNPRKVFLETWKVLENGVFIHLYLAYHFPVGLTMCVLGISSFCYGLLESLANIVHKEAAVKWMMYCCVLETLFSSIF